MIDIKTFYEELNEAILAPDVVQSDSAAVAYSMAIEYGKRLSSAEVFDNFIPGPVSGTGKNRRRFRIDGYQIDEADSSVHLIITDFSFENEISTITKTDADSIFKQAEHFVELCADGSIWDRENSVNEQAELSSFLQDRLARDITRLRFHLFTNRAISKQLRELDQKIVCDQPSDFQIWDLNRLKGIAESAIGTEEFIVDFTEFTPNGIPCLTAHETNEYTGILAVIDGDALAGIYDRFGSRVLEGNVRAYLSARGKVNKGIQSTIKNDSSKFFAYNNGISCTATEVEIEKIGEVNYLKSAKYLQIVNGGQTTASIFLAAQNSETGFSRVSGISVQMKLSVIKPESAEALDELIYNVARWSNTQNQVKPSDFFSNHEFHRIIEGHSSREQAPPIAGETTFPTYWFYERARGSYEARQLVLKASEKNDFKKLYPSNQKIEKLDLAKYIHAWAQRPHDICDGGQKNFNRFAEEVVNSWGQNGDAYRSREYFRECIAKAILYKRLEVMVKKADWYQAGSGFLQPFVAYTISLLSLLVQTETSGGGLNFLKIWNEQKLSPVLEDELMRIGETVANLITAPSHEGASALQGLQWFKNKGCWEKLKELQNVSLSQSFVNELLSRDDLGDIRRERRRTGAQERELQDIQMVFELGYQKWRELKDWSDANNPRYGMELDLIRQMGHQRFYPTPRQAAVLSRILSECLEEGFTP